MKDRLDEIGHQLEAIGRAIEAAHQEPDAERREQWLQSAAVAAAVVREEHAELVDEHTRRRAAFRYIPGGLAAVATGLGAVAARIREQPATAAAVAVTTASAAALAVLLWTGPGPVDTPPHAGPAPAPTYGQPPRQNPWPPSSPPPSQPSALDDGTATRVDITQPPVDFVADDTSHPSASTTAPPTTGPPTTEPPGDGDTTTPPGDGDETDPPDDGGDDTGPISRDHLLCINVHALIIRLDLCLL